MSWSNAGRMAKGARFGPFPDLKVEFSTFVALPGIPRDRLTDVAVVRR
jgi:hypothetical protein